MRRRNRRVTRLGTRLAGAFHELGRPLDLLALPGCIKWAELECLRVDLFNALQNKQQARTKDLLDRYLATCRLQVNLEKQLGMTPEVGMKLRGQEPEDPVLQVLRLRSADDH